MHIKTTASWGPAFNEPSVQLVKVARHGMGMHDRRLFEKRASPNLLHCLGDIQSHVRPDESLIHLLAIGATEDYGPNRNGDGFSRRACRDFHSTFEKFARFYRDHKNQDPAESYGRIVKSAWNEDMRRVELLVALNATKSAATRNGGLLADRELNLLEAGKDIPVSMACKVAYDICSCCGNRAPTVKNYCVGTEDGGHCKAGGLRDHIGELREVDGSPTHLYADNPEPYFFDISHVFRPADRIAYVTGQLTKSAAAGPVMSIKSAELSRQLGVTVPLAVLQADAADRGIAAIVKLATDLATAEQQQTGDGFYRFTCDPSVAPLNPPTFVREKVADAFRALADHAVCLSPQRFIELMTCCSPAEAATKSAQVAAWLPGVFQRLIRQPEFIEKAATDWYAASPCASMQFQKWAASLTSELSLHPEHVHRRVTVAALHGSTDSRTSNLVTEKTADTHGAMQLAEEYAMYQLGFLSALSPSSVNLPLTCQLLLAQNHNI